MLIELLGAGVVAFLLWFLFWWLPDRPKRSAAALRVEEANRVLVGWVKEHPQLHRFNSKRQELIEKVLVAHFEFVRDYGWQGHSEMKWVSEQIDNLKDPDDFARRHEELVKAVAQQWPCPFFGVG